jgi:hypothetical protein
MNYQSLDQPEVVSTPKDRRKKVVAWGFIAFCCLFAFVLFWKQLYTPPELFRLNQDTSICKASTYSKTTLKIASESTMVALFRDTKGFQNFEASDVVRVKNVYYVVYDNLYAIGRISQDLPFRSDKNLLLGPFFLPHLIFFF